MKIEKIILILLVAVGSGFAIPVSAAREVPKTQPLQPAPVNSKPNYSQNINTPGTDINNSLQSQVPAVQNPNPSNPTDTTSPDQTTTAPIVGDVPTTSSTFYWVLIFIGVAGLMALALWSYFRFLRKQ